MYTVWAGTSQHILHAHLCMSTQTYTSYTFVYIVSKTSVTRASASSDMFSINIKKQNKTTTRKTKQSKIKMREVGDMKGRLQKKVVNKGAEIWEWLGEKKLSYIVCRNRV